MSVSGRVSSPAVQVEADVYSGRPNPRWTLAAEPGETLVRRLLALPAESAPGVQPNGLGYRGMIVHLDPAPDGLCATIRVANGLACCESRPGVESAAGTTAGRSCRRDISRDVEHWLMESGARVLDANLLKMLRVQIKPSR